MFCSECGTKNEKQAKFCENCGHPLAKINIKHLKKEKKLNQPNSILVKLKSISKRTKWICLIIVLVFFVFLGSYVFLNHCTSSGEVAKTYFAALTNYNANEIYSLLEPEKSSFTDRKVLQQLLDREKANQEEIVNYKVLQNVASADGLRRMVTFSYTTKTSATTKKASITLIKKKTKKWLFFDDWVIQSSTLATISNHTLEVPRGTTISIEGIRLEVDYLDKNLSTETTDVYRLPAMYQMEYRVKATLPNGIVLENGLTIDAYHKTYALELSKEDLSESLINQIKETTNSSLKVIYDGVISKQAFQDFQSNFVYENGDVSALDTAYQKLIKAMEDSGGALTAFAVTDVGLEEAELDADGHLYLSLKVNYDFTFSYQEPTGETKTNQSKDYDYVNLTFDYENETLHLIDAKNLMSHFSKYF